MTESFESMLTGGHPNSLGRTVEVVDIILADKSKLQELYDCYFSTDEIVRLRTSNAFKRIAKVQPGWVAQYLDLFITKISQIDQASTQWTLAQLFLILEKYLNSSQKNQAIEILKRNLVNSNDWIVLNFTMEILAKWAKKDNQLKSWLLPHLEKLALDARKSVANRAKKYKIILA